MTLGQHRLRDKKHDKMDIKGQMKRCISFLIDCNIAILLFSLFITVGVVALIADFSWFEFPTAFDGVPLDPCHESLIKVAAWSFAAGIAIGVLALMQLQKTKPQPDDNEFSKKMFGRCLVGIGFILLLDALINVVAVAGFARAGAVFYVFESGNTYSLIDTNAPSPQVIYGIQRSNVMQFSNSIVTTTIPPASTNILMSVLTNSRTHTVTVLKASQINLIRALQVLFALGFTVMGALFFFAKSLWEKMQTNPIVQFDERIFWAGLWFRLGEAVVFTLVIFLTLLCKQYDEALSMMPFIALLIGLSVKTAENLIAGLTQRVFDSVNAFVSKS